MKKINHKMKRALAAVLAVCALTVPASASYGGYTLRTESHEKYLDGMPNGTFQPSGLLSRAQAASIVYNLLEQKPEGGWQYSDIPSGAWYERAACSLAWAGILPDDGSGRFRPNDPITRKECAAMLSHFLTPVETRGISPDMHASDVEAVEMPDVASQDVQPDTSDAEANAHPLDAEADGKQETYPEAQPNGSDAETVGLRYAFPDVSSEDPAAAAIDAVVARGLFSTDENGLFRPDAPMTRAETAVVFNGLLGRAPNVSVLTRMRNLQAFTDVNYDHWAYAAILEATINHTYQEDGAGYEQWTSFEQPPVSPTIADGFHNIDGWLCYARNGQYITSETVDGFPFDANGHYTTGNAALDQKLAEIVRTQTNEGMSRDEKLRALYHYVRDNFTYIKRDLVAKGQTGWEPAYAERFFADGRGNCFSFAAAFQQLARAIGIDAHTVVGNLGKNRQEHGWVEISLDGVNAVYDPEIEMVYRGRGRQYDLFRFQYSAAPFDYWK